MKRLILILALLGGMAQAQVGVHFMGYGSVGSAKYGSNPGMAGTGMGFSAAFQATLFMAKAGLDRFVSGRQVEVAHGTRHFQLQETFFKYQVGVAIPPSGDDIGFHAALLWGFLSGMDKLEDYHRYPDGTVSYGMDQSQGGVFKALRPFAAVATLQGAVLFRSRVGVFLGLDWIWRKKRDTFEFRDELFTKYVYLAANGLPSHNGYAGEDDTHGLRLHIGVHVYLGQNGD